MIKNIIKRIIVGVGIALILGLIGSCEVKAVYRSVTYDSFNFYRVMSDQVYTLTGTETSTFTWGNVPFTRFSNDLSYMTSFYFLRGNVTIDSGYPFKDHEYFSFIVNGQNANVGAVMFSGLSRMNCTVTDVEVSSFSTSTAVRNNTAVVECPTSGISDANATSSNLSLYLYNWNTGNVFIYIEKTIYMYDSPISDKLQSIISLQNATNSKLDILDGDLDNLFTRLGNMNTTLSSILTKANNIFTRQQEAINAANTNSQQQTQAINNMNDTIKDDETSNVDTGAIGNASDNIASNNVISNLVLLPVNLFTKILDSSSAECQTFSLGTLYGEELKMPCIALNKYLGTPLVNVIDVLISGLFIYHISRKMVKVFEELSSLRSGGNEV